MAEAVADFREPFPVRSFEVDPAGRLTLRALGNALQEAAGQHAGRLGVSVEQLRARGLTWFLSRLHLRMQRWPRIGDELWVTTWPAEMGRPYAIRDFRLGLDPNGGDIGVASSAWLLVELDGRKPVRRPPDWLRRLHPEPPRRALGGRPRRLPPCVAVGDGRTLTTRRSDLDLNGHVNNAVFLDALAESLAADRWRRQRVAELEIEFRAEAHFGDAIVGHSSAGADGACLHGLFSAADGRELARARIAWVDDP